MEMHAHENPTNESRWLHDDVLTTRSCTITPQTKTPNSDTPYSMLFMDLRAEPIVLSVPAVQKSRYYSVQLINGNTCNYGYIGRRAPPGIKKVVKIHLRCHERSARNPGQQNGLTFR